MIQPIRENRQVLGNPPSLAAFFDVWRRNSGEFLRYGARHLSYSSTAQSASSFAVRLREAGIVKGERIVIWSENRPEWIVALWGCLLEGVIAVPVDFRSSSAFVARIAAIVNARALLLGEGIAAPAGISCSVWSLDSVLSNIAASTGTFSPAAPAGVAEVLFTSGATGDPKGVTITHRNILANLQPIDGGIDKYRRYIRLFSPIRF